jgi:hypothetical protein
MVQTLTLSTDGNQLIENRVLTAPARDGALQITSATPNGTAITLTAANGAKYTYSANASHLTRLGRGIGAGRHVQTCCSSGGGAGFAGNRV